LSKDNDKGIAATMTASMEALVMILVLQSRLNETKISESFILNGGSPKCQQQNAKTFQGIKKGISKKEMKFQRVDIS
jgi:hypothetical protein